DRCAFPMQDRDTWSSQATLVDELATALQVVTVQNVLLDLNRQGSWVDPATLSGDAGVPGVQWAFAWNSGDLNVAYWIPQGLTGSPDADASGLVDGKRVVIATWYYSAAEDPSSPGGKGVRINLADATDPSEVSYRLLLLVEPYHDGARANFRAIDVHGGGAVWFGSYLYVTDTSNGFRVFDLGRILSVDTSQDTIGYSAADSAYYAYEYKYVVPQIGTYQHASACSPQYSFVGLDRSTSPPSLISGEYDSDSAAGRVYHWPLDATTHRLPSGTFYPEEAFYMGYSHVQGAVAHDGDFFLSSSEPASGRGALATNSESGFGAVIPWIDGPEDLLYDLLTDQLWGLGEHSPRRYIFAVDVAEAGL
ncbi:MAG: hypothetical protein GY851_13170, partial [bacterium]|nr:hypothetical protein [bacterium]